MGAIHFSVDLGLVQVLKGCLPLQVFVETGTFKGDSIALVRSCFEKLYSVENAEAYFKKACDRFREDPAIEVFRGESPGFLRSLRPQLADKAVLYWLDAHWCVAQEETGGQKSQCPLIRELEAIEKLNEQSVVLIDDARLFLSTPPAPHEASNWPQFDAILSKLRELSPTHCVSVLNDTILFVPRSTADAVQNYARHHSYDLLEELSKSRRFAEVEEQCEARLQALEKTHQLYREGKQRIKTLEAQLAKAQKSPLSRIMRAIKGR